MYPDCRGLRLEEAEKASNEWHIVMSFFTGKETALQTLAGEGGRIFKSVRVNSLTGESVALKAWKL